jgi:ParB family chromosome partitioning protein
MAAARPKPGLGKGLSALLGEAAAPAAGDAPVPGVRMLPIALIAPMPEQPRQRFDPDALADLVQSIRAHGILTPLLVRPRAGRYELIAGERRWRAAQQAELHEVPVVVRDMDDSAALQAAIVENTQRADLNPIEEARGYQRLQEEFGHAPEAIARLVSKSRSHVSNMMRLLDLPAEVRDRVQKGELSAGHARAMIGLSNSVRMAELAFANGLSVRDVERYAAREKAGGAAAHLLGKDQGGAIARRAERGRAAAPRRDADVVALEERLTAALGMRVRIDAERSPHSVTVEWGTLDQLDLLAQRLSGGRV